MYHGNFPVNLSKFFKKEPSDSGDGSIRCDCASICRNRYCRCFTASKFCTKYCTCHWCLNKPQRQDLQRINELPAYNRGRRGGVSQSDSCSGVEDEKEEEEEEEEEEDTYWKDWCRETGKYSPWNVPCVKQKQKETSPKESVGETPLRSRSKNSKSESKSISLEESPIRKKRENKSKSKNSTSDKKRKKE